MVGGLFVLSCGADMWKADMFAFIKDLTFISWFKMTSELNSCYNNDQGFLLLGFCPWQHLFHIGCIRVIKLLARQSLLIKYIMRNAFHNIRAVNLCPWKNRITITKGEAFSPIESTLGCFQKRLIMISGNKGDKAVCARSKTKQCSQNWMYLNERILSNLIYLCKASVFLFQANQPCFSVLRASFPH